ncbi:hypothetical protein [Ferrovibrio xuzhouensis]|uniref:Uncharacterized protein n=1 Tax=Ferrovibrio xuzhouensis TaxID=1576914 RepID=A0ABV7VB53_9PROT
MIAPQYPPADGAPWLPRCGHGDCMAWGVFGEGSRGPFWCRGHLPDGFLPGMPAAPAGILPPSANVPSAAQGALL